MEMIRYLVSAFPILISYMILSTFCFVSFLYNDIYSL